LRSSSLVISAVVSIKPGQPMKQAPRGAAVGSAGRNNGPSSLIPPYTPFG
jgi:hypothetical protein